MLDEIDALTERGARGRDKANELAEMWRSSERAHRERQHRENRALWFEFFSRMSESHRELSEDYAARAEALCAEEGA